MNHHMRSFQFGPIEMGPNDVDALLDEYIATDFPGRRPATMHWARCYVMKFTRWMRACHHKVISTAVMQDYVAFLHERHKPDSMQEYFASLKRFLGWLYRTGRCTTEPQYAVRMPRVKIIRDRNPITREEYARLREVAGNHYMGWVIMLGWNTGMSIADCMALRWGDVDFDRCIIQIRRIKTGTQATIPFSADDELGRALIAQRNSAGDVDPDDFVCEEAGMRVRLDSEDVAGIGTRQFAHLAKKIGLPKGKSFHSLRHSFVSMLANSGMSTALASKVSGHTDPRVFAAYVHVNTDALRKGVAEARANAGNLQEVVVEPHGKRHRAINSYVFRPNRVYMVKSGRIKLPGGEDLSYVKSTEHAEGKQAVVVPCDVSGEPTSSLQLVVDIRDVSTFD